AYVQQSAKSDVQPYWDIANNWVLGANFYPTELGPSFVAHLNLIASTTEYKALTAVGDFPPSEPWGCGNVAKPPMRYVTPTVSPHPFQTGPPPCYDQFHTVADLLDCIYPSESNCSASNPVPWRYYAPGVKNSASTGYIWSAFQAIKRVYGNGKGQDWKNDVISPPGKIFHAISSGALDNIGVTWIVPESAWSDHAGMDTDEGPSWVADITNAIGARTSLWNHSVIVVVWDDWGGWYDNAPPPTLTWGMGGLGQYYRGYGIRTPLLILSPYAKQGQDSGHVSLRSFESGSILKFIEQVFNFNSAGLAALPCKSSDYSYYSCDIQYTDASSNSIGYVLDTSQSPRAYGTPIPTKYPPSKFMSGSGYYNYAVQAPDNE
ncbi:MAG: alkaline phosphatase family protein, partial [Candidatus Cybelea sp.]